MIALRNYKIPAMYWVKRLVYECGNCGLQVEDLIPNGHDLVKFLERGGGARWLPVFGEGGYLYLMEKLVSEHRQDDEITMKKAKIFIDELEKYDIRGRQYEFASMKRDCDYCHAKKLKLKEEQTIVNPVLEWLRIN